MTDFYPSSSDAIRSTLGRDRLLAILQKMVLIRHFELRAEAAYQQGHIGGFFHSYVGQEAIQTAACEIIDHSNWFATSYRCHALALLLGASPDELMAELFGKESGNAHGHGGSMHMFLPHMLGGFGIVSNQIPAAAGAAFSAKYRGTKEISVCFLGDGAMAQGSFHETLNLTSLWSLPCLFVVENNEWGMGTHVSRAVANFEQFSGLLAKAYNIESMKLDGMDFFSCYGGFEEAYKKVQSSGRPFVVECLTERFKGHSISDPGLYRTKEELKRCMERDPISLLKNVLIAKGIITEADYEAIDTACRARILESLKFADESPFPDLNTLGKGVYVEEGGV